MQGRISERSRQNYLDAMGIQAWFPRKILSNSLPPRVFDFPEEEEASAQLQESSPILSETNQVASASGVLHAKSLLGIAEKKTEKETPAKETITEPQPAEKPEPLATNQKTTSKFRLVSLSVNEDCLVIAEMPHTGLNQFSRFHQRLLNDILRALDIPAPQQNYEFSEFVWPMESLGLMTHLSMDDNNAADAVCAYLSNQFGLARRKVVLLFGQAAARFVIDPQRNFDELRGIQPGLHAEQYFVASHGLNELMKVPALKSETWKDLSPLKSKLV
ncbi:hypothetical protein EOPP23_04200 [Endozoicomonas sp. OPT23]|uniref:hypothetical protein n=1 Tax=Endozoicomonas sp. OPT23 TaxID=2072845 RepID=UPI00129AB293|nr:hypothetical protein [Endozoicomonas sp. OPT23]MRI32198.1 hypothetical protein [Endozoicomonas sp. OPT23]